MRSRLLGLCYCHCSRNPTREEGELQGMEALEATMDAWDQFVAFLGLFVIAWWITLYPHDDDGVPEPKRKTLAERKAHAAKIDPGIWLATSGRLSFKDPMTQVTPREEKVWE